GESCSDSRLRCRSCDSASPTSAGKVGSCSGSFLVSQIRDSSHPAHDLKYTIGALRTAQGVHLKDQTDESTGNRCNFCGKSPDGVRTMIVSDESTICDECVDMALDIISRAPGHMTLSNAGLLILWSYKHRESIS